MQYNYSQTGYHPREVSFEVAAILIDEEESRLRGYDALKGSLLGGSNYARGDYSRENAFSFDPVTEQATTVKYVSHKHKMASRFLRHSAHMQEKKESKTFWKNIGRRARSNVKQAFEAVVQNIVLHHVIKKLMAKKFEQQLHQLLRRIKKHPPVFVSENAHKALHKEAVRLGYTIHPHVDALLRERSKGKWLQL